MNSDGYFIGGLILFFLVVFTAIGIGSCQDAKESNRILKQCMQDHKEYECIAMLQKPSSDTNTVFIPVVTGR